MAFRKLATLLLMLAATALVAAGCGGSGGGDDGGGGSTAAAAETPAPLEEGGDFLFCTDVPYPPAEYLEGNEFKGYEIDIAQEVAMRIGTTATFQATKFDAIIASLNADKCDAVISSMNSTEERKKEVDFVDYMTVGQSLMVKPELVEEIESLDDLAGRDVAVQVGTTLKATLDAKSKELQADGKEPINIVTYPDAGAAASALKADKVHVFFGDSPVVADYINKDEEAFAFAGEPIDPLPVGIAIRKSDTDLRDAVQEAIDDMYADGTMDDILEEWKIGDFQLEEK